MHLTLYPYQESMCTTIIGARDCAGLVKRALVPNIMEDTGALYEQGGKVCY